jgi:hypothetical protein
LQLIKNNNFNKKFLFFKKNEDQITKLKYNNENLLYFKIQLLFKKEKNIKIFNYFIKNQFLFKKEK